MNHILEAKLHQISVQSLYGPELQSSYNLEGKLLIPRLSPLVKFAREGSLVVVYGGKAILSNNLQPGGDVPIVEIISLQPQI